MKIELDSVIKQSGMQEDPRSYLHKSFKISGYISIALSSLSLLYFLNPIFIAFIPIGIFAFSITLSSFILYPYVVRRIDSGKISRKLLDIYSMIYSLSSSDVDYIFTVLTESLDKDVAKPFKRYLYNRSILGLSVIDSLTRAGDRCPNTELRNTFYALAESIKSSGDVRNLLRHVFERSIVERRGGLEKKVRSSMVLGEFYITLNILLPVIIIIILVVFSMIGGNLLGLNPIIFMPLSIYLVPLISMIFYILSGD